MTRRPPKPRSATMEPEPRAKASIESTKFVPPRAAKHMLPRVALLQRLVDSRRLRCTVIQGPAGSGKTSTLIAWRQALLALDFDIAWLTLTPDDNDVAAFFECLLGSLARVDPAPLREARLLASASQHEPSAIEHRAIALSQGLATRSRELVLMIDDLQHLSSHGVIQALHWLLDYAPASLHLMFASRNALPQPLSTLIDRLRDQKQLAEFNLRDLRFSAAETESYLRRQLGHVTPKDVALLHELTDGWVAGLQLFAVDMKTREGKAYAPVPLRDARTFARYFEHEVLMRLSAEDLDLLTRVSICRRFCALLCTALLDDPLGLERMILRLNQIDSSDLFLAQIEDSHGEPWYRLHPLLREVLAARFALLPGDERRALQSRAWRWFEANGFVEEAVRHAVQAGDAPAAATLVGSSARDLLNRGELGQMMRLIHLLPVEQINADAELRIALAHVHLYSRELEAVDRDISALARLPLEGRQRAEITLLRAGLALQRDDVDTAVQILPELDHWPADADDFMSSLRANVLAWVHMARGDFVLARRILDDQASRGAGMSARLTGMCLAGLSHTLEGRMLEAERLYRDVLKVADREGAALVGVSNMAAALLGDVLYELDEVKAACELLESRIELIEHFAIPEAMLRTSVVLAIGHWASGGRLEALAQLDRLEDFSTRNGIERLQAHALAWRVRLLHQQGDTQAAADCLQRLEELAARHGALGNAASVEIGIVARRAQVATHLQHGDIDAAARTLYDLIATVEAAGRLRPAVTIRLQLALIERRRGRRDVGTRLLVDALRMGHRLGLLRSLLDASRHVPAALEDLKAGQTLEPVLSFYVDRLLEASARHTSAAARLPPPLPMLPIDSLKEREREILGLLAQALPNKKIARIIGLSHETVKWHLRNIYAKLGVTARDEAVARARDYGL